MSDAVGDGEVNEKSFSLSSVEEIEKNVGFEILPRCDTDLQGVDVREAARINKDSVK